MSEREVWERSLGAWAQRCEPETRRQECPVSDYWSPGFGQVNRALIVPACLKLS